MPAISLVIDTPDLAKHYEAASAERQFRHGKDLLEQLRLAPGDRVLDVGCGTGLLAQYASGKVTPNGLVVGIDPLPLRIDIAKQKATLQLSYQVGDANDLGVFQAASFDVAYLNAVFHWLPEKRGPLAGLFRLLAPGGRLGLTTGAKDRPNTIQVVRKSVLGREPYRAHVDAEETFAHSVSAEELRALLEETGFQIERLEHVSQSYHHASGGALVDFANASSFGNYLGRVPEALREAARRELIAEFEKLRDARGIPHQATRIEAVARKPRSANGRGVS